MAKTDVVTKGVSDLSAAQQNANQNFLTTFYDEVAADQPKNGFSQSDIDNAVQAAQALDAAALAATNEQAQAQVAALQQQVAQVTSKEQGEESVIHNLSGSVANLQVLLSQINTLIQPAATAGQPATGASSSNAAATGN